MSSRGNIVTVELASLQVGRKLARNRGQKLAQREQEEQEEQEEEEEEVRASRRRQRVSSKFTWPRARVRISTPGRQEIINETFRL